MIGLGAGLAFHFRDRHFAGFGKQLRQMALVRRIQVLNQYECHAGIVRQVTQQLRECLQTTRGSSYANNNGKRASLVGFLGRHDCLLGGGGLVVPNAASPWTRISRP